METEGMPVQQDDGSRLPVLVFRLGEHDYALPIANVIEVSAMVELLNISDAHPALLGVANRRGSPLPILDLRPIFGLETEAITPATLFVVAHHRHQMAGLVVDAIHQVEYIQRSQLGDSQAAGLYIERILSYESRLIQLIALKPLLAAFLSHDIPEQVFEGDSHHE